MACLLVLTFQVVHAEEPEPEGTSTATLEVSVYTMGLRTKSTLEVYPHEARYWSAYVAGRSPRPVRTIATDDQGQATIKGLEPGAYQVVADHGNGQRSGGRADVDAGEGTVYLRLDALGGPHAVTGEVRDFEGAPLHGLISAHRWIGSSDAFTKSSCLTLVRLKQGKFTFPSLPYGEVFLSVRTPGGVNWGLRSIHVPHPGPVRLRMRHWSFHTPANVELRVLDAVKGKPIAGATVSCHHNGRSFRVQSNEAGEAHLQVAHIDDPLRITKDGYADVTTTARGALTTGEVRLEREVSVQGRVRGPEGVVSGAEVHAVWGTAQDPAGASTTTRKDGSFTIEGVPPGKASVFVLGGGWCSRDLGLAPGKRTGRSPFAPRQVDVPRAGLDSVELKAESMQTVSVAIASADDSPIRGPVRLRAILAAQSPEARWLRRTSQLRWFFGLDRTGQIQLPRQVPVRVAAYTQGRLVARSEVVNDPESMRLVFKPSRTIRVRVVEKETQRPISGVGVEVRPQAWEASGWWLWNKARPTDIDGWAAVGPCPEGQYRVSVRAFGYVNSQSDLWGQREHAFEDENEVTLELEKAGAIEGTIIGPEGMAGQMIELVADPPSRVLPSKDGASTVTHHGRQRRLEVVIGEPFAIGNLPLVEHDLEAKIDWQGFEWTVKSKSKPGESVALVLEKGAALVATRSVRLLDFRGKPLLHAVVELRGKPGTGWRSAISKPRVRDGVITWAPGKQRSDLWLVVSQAYSREGAAGGGRFGPFEGDAPPEVLQLTPPRQLRGTIVDGEGKGVAGALVDIECLHRHEDVWVAHAREYGATRSGPDGRYVLENLPPGRLRLTYRLPQRYAKVARRVVDSDRETVPVVRVRPATKVTLVVLDENDQPIPKARVSVTRSVDGVVTEFAALAGNRSTPMTDDNGRIELHRLDATAVYTLSVRRPRARFGDGQHVISDWKPADTTIRFPHLGMITGSVVDTDGKAVANMAVHITHRVRPGFVHTDTIYTDAEGAFEARPPEVDRLTVGVVPGSHGSRQWSKPNYIQRLQEREFGNPLLFTVPSAEILRIPTDLIRKHMPAASYQMGGAQQPGNMSRAGVLPLTGSHVALLVKPDVLYSIFICPIADDKNSSCLYLTAKGGERKPASIEVGSAEISGRVIVDVDGGEPAGFNVFARSGDGFVRVVTVDEQGHFTLAGLLEGSVWQLAVAPKRTGPAQMTTPRAVTAGSTDVKLTYPR